MGILDWFRKGTGDGGEKPDKPEDKGHQNGGAQTFADMTRGFQFAVNRAQQLVERHYLEILDRYFVEDRDGRQYPKIVSFKMHDEVMHVPMIALVPPDALMISEMEIEMAMRINKNVLKKASKKEDAHKDDTTRSSFEVDFTSMSETNGGGKSNAIRVKMKFKSAVPPEGMSRIIEEYRNTIVKKANGKDNPPGGQVIHMDKAPDGGPDDMVENFAGGETKQLDKPPESSEKTSTPPQLNEEDGTDTKEPPSALPPEDGGSA